MDIIDAFKEPVLLLPKRNDKDTFPELLTKIYDDFLALVSKIDQGSLVDKITVNKQTLENLCQKFIQSSITYYEGFPAKAYIEFEEGMSLIERFLFPSTNVIIAKSLEPFYRGRTGSNIQFQKHEMFHMPFEKREFVTTQRFSVPGLPCLYLSNSIYVCWEELRRPDINKMQVTRMRLENYRITFLDLSLTPQSLTEMLEVTTSEELNTERGKTKQEAVDDWDSTTLDYLMKWPLIAACSIKVKEPQGTFKPEYIFPQFLLQWVTQNKRIDGIKYFSVEAHVSAKIDHSKLVNYALPVKTFGTKGLCASLVDSFSLTEPISWEMLTTSNPEIFNHDNAKLKRVIHRLGQDSLLGQLELVKGKKVSYWHTVFGKMEMEMTEMDHEKIHLP